MRPEITIMPNIIRKKRKPKKVARSTSKEPAAVEPVDEEMEEIGEEVAAVAGDKRKRNEKNKMLKKQCNDDSDDEPEIDADLNDSLERIRKLQKNESVGDHDNDEDSNDELDITVYDDDEESDEESKENGNIS